MRLLALFCALAATAALPAVAQEAVSPQIPPLQVCNKTAIKGDATVVIAARALGGHTGTFRVAGEAGCPDKNGYASGSIKIDSINMSDSTILGTIAFTSIEQLTSTGTDTPTAYLKGRCTADEKPGFSCWLMIADNSRAPKEKPTPSVIGFLVFDRNGKRVAYGTGPVAKGAINVVPTPN